MQLGAQLPNFIQEFNFQILEESMNFLFFIAKLYSCAASLYLPLRLMGFQSGSMVKNLPANAGISSLIPGLGRSPGEGNGNPLHYSCLGNPMDRGYWWAAVHGMQKSWTQLSNKNNKQ